MSGPYADAWEIYRRAGWIGVLPLPPRKKAHPPKGFTGEAGAWPSYADGQAWADGPEAAGNLALRLPHGVIGIDVDAYDGKRGAQTLARRAAQWGPLPPTWESSSRTDGASSIRLYRVSEGLSWPGELGEGVELIQYRHRYAVVWPSVHPSGAVYRWTTPEGVTSTAVPDVESLPWLPQAWVDGLTGGREHVDTPRNDWTGEQVRGWLLTRPRGQEEPCERTRRAVDDALYQLHAGGSAHDVTMSAVMRVVRLADEHHAGLLAALAELRAAFLAEVTRADRAGQARTRGQAEAEWARGLHGAVQKVSATPAGVDGCDCGGRLLAGLVDPPSAASEDEDGEEDDLAGVWEAPAGQQPGAGQGEPGNLSQEARDAFFEQQVAAEMLRIQVREEAARRVRKTRRADAAPPAIIPLGEFLAVPDEPARYRIDGLWPVGGRALFSAQFKAGKTTTIGNLIRSLADGEPFLGRFTVDPPAGRIVLIDDELDERMLRRWLRDQGVAHADRVAVLPLRGRVSTFDLLDDDTRAAWAQALRDANASVVILDCLAPILDALGLSEDKEAGRFLVAFDEMLSQANVGEAVMVHHMGHSGERARGASRLRDWPDVEWKLVRDKEDGEDNPAARRYFSAYGRDVDVPESALTYQAAGRRLTLAGGSRKESAAADAAEAVAEFVAGAPDSSAAAIERALAGEFGQKGVRAAIKKAVADGLVLVRPGPKGARLHYLNPARAVDNPVDNSIGLNGQNDVSAGDEVSSSATSSIGLAATSTKTTSSPSRRAETAGHSASSSARHHLVNEVSATSSARPPYRGGRAADEGPRADVIPTADERDVTDLLPPARVWLDPSGDLIDTHTGEVLNTTGGAQ